MEPQKKQPCKSTADTTISTSAYQAPPIQPTPIHIVSPQSFDFESSKGIRVSDVSQLKKIRVPESEVVAAESCNLDVQTVNLGTDGVEAHRTDFSDEAQLRNDNKGKKVCEDNHSDGSLVSRSIDKEISKIKYVVGNGDGLLRNHVDEEAGVERMGKRHQLPESIQVIEKNVGVENVVDDDTVESNNGSLDLLNLLKFVQGKKYGLNSDDVDFSEITTKQALIFLRPRWWPPEGDNEW